MIIIRTNTRRVPDFYKEEVFWPEEDAFRTGRNTTIIIDTLPNNPSKK